MCIRNRNENEVLTKVLARQNSLAAFLRITQNWKRPRARQRGTRAFPRGKRRRPAGGGARAADWAGSRLGAGARAALGPSHGPRPSVSSSPPKRCGDFASVASRVWRTHTPLSFVKWAPAARHGRFLKAPRPWVSYLFKSRPFRLFPSRLCVQRGVRRARALPSVIPRAS